MGYISPQKGRSWVPMVLGVTSEGRFPARSLERGRSQLPGYRLQPISARLHATGCPSDRELSDKQMWIPHGTIRYQCPSPSAAAGHAIGISRKCFQVCRSVLCIPKLLKEAICTTNDYYLSNVSSWFLVYIDMKLYRAGSTPPVQRPKSVFQWGKHQLFEAHIIHMCQQSGGFRVTNKLATLRLVVPSSRCVDSLITTWTWLARRYSWRTITIDYYGHKERSSTIM